jgi:hypothetical protein
VVEGASTRAAPIAFIKDNLVMFARIAGQENHRVFAWLAAVGNNKAEGACIETLHGFKMANLDFEMAQRDAQKAVPSPL